MKRSERDVLWRKYLSAVWYGGTKAERRAAFDAWKVEEFKAAESKAKRDKAKALSGS